METRSPFPLLLLEQKNHSLFMESKGLVIDLRRSVHVPDFLDYPQNVLRLISHVYE